MLFGLVRLSRVYLLPSGSLFEYFDSCYRSCGFRGEYVDAEELDENCPECANPADEYSGFIDFYKSVVDYNDLEIAPRFQSYPDDDDLEKYFSDNITDRI